MLIEKKVEKSRVIKAIKMGFAPFSKKNELVIFVLISFTANISRSTIYNTLRINNRAEKNYLAKNNI